MPGENKRRSHRSGGTGGQGAGEPKPRGLEADRIARLPGGVLAPSQQWATLAAVVSVAGVLLGVVAVTLSLLSVASSSRAVLMVPPQAASSPTSQTPGQALAAPTSVALAPAPGAPTPVAASPSGPATPLPAGSVPPAGPERRTKGSPDAPVVITEWFDYLCPTCVRFSLTREAEIERLYISTGKVRFVIRNAAFIGPESFLAAEAAECAADQGRYWDYRALLFQRLAAPDNLGALRPENLKRYAAELGLNQVVFDRCLDQGTHRGAVRAEAREADAAGIKAVPSFFINGRSIQGVPTVEILGRLIEEELAKGR